MFASRATICPGEATILGGLTDVGTAGSVGFAPTFALASTASASNLAATRAASSAAALSAARASNP